MGLYVLLMGVQGAGKGEQAKFISTRYNIPHISTGDLFRAMRTRTDDLAQEIQNILASGKLVSDELTNRVVEERLAQPDAQNGVLLDGYPRTTGQADFLADLLQKKGEKINVAILFELDLYTAFKRAFGRVQTADKTQTFNIFYMNDAIDYTAEKHPEKAFPPRIIATLKASGETLTRREDDADALSVLKRIDTYIAETAPLISYYEQKGSLKRLDANQPIEIVSQHIQDILG
jgi:adenylate kinase